MMTGLVLLVITLCLGAFALPLAERLIVGFVRWSTQGLPPEIRDRRRGEIQSELFEQRRQDAADGYKPAEIAARILVRWARGIPDELAWHREVLRAAKKARIVKKPRAQILRPTGIPSQAALGIPTVTEDPPLPPLGWLDGTASAAISAAGRYDEQSRQMRRAAIQAQLTSMWGNEVVCPPPSEPPAEEADP